MPQDRLESALRGAGFRGALRSEAALAPMTTWRIGGPAELLATPLDRGDLELAIQWAGDAGVPWRVMGNGSNLLVRDEGVRGLVVRIRRCLDQLAFDGNRVRVGAGNSFPAVARSAAARGLAGIEFGAGIPGTVGGAIVMNAGWHEFEIGNVVLCVDFLEANGTIAGYRRNDCEFAYRTSRFRGRPGVVLETTLELEPGDSAKIGARLEHYATSRKTNQPTELPSCGSVFLKPPGDFAGRLIEAAGLKGLRVGDVEVSPKHANFFVNHGEGTAADVLALVERVEYEVEQQFGIRLTREFELW